MEIIFFEISDVSEFPFSCPELIDVPRTPEMFIDNGAKMESDNFQNFSRARDESKKAHLGVLRLPAQNMRLQICHRARKLG